MGLDTSHGCWHGSYSSFEEWRDAVAVAAGYPMLPPEITEQIAGPGVGFPDLPWDQVPEGAENGSWPAPPADILLVLLAHSDCDGVIYPEHAMPLAQRLRELMPRMENDYDRERATQFANGLQTAASRDEYVEFY